MVIIQVESDRGIIEEIYPRYFTTKERAEDYLKLVNANHIIDPVPWSTNVLCISPNAEFGKRFYVRLIELKLDN